MKKTTIASIATAGVSLILFIVSAIFIVWDREKPDATSSILITSILTLACALIAIIVFAILFDNKHIMLMLIPMIHLVMVVLLSLISFHLQLIIQLY